MAVNNNCELVASRMAAIIGARASSGSIWRVTSATITTDPDLLAQFSVNDKLPVTAVLVEIDTMYFQCARAIKRAGLWDQTAQVDPKSLPTAGQLVRSTMQEFDAETYDGALQERQAKTLY